MNKFPNKCIVDTNVPKTASLANNAQNIPAYLIKCVLACVKAIQHVTKNGGLVLDNGGDIYREYRRQLSLSGQPGVGDVFMKWVHDNQWKLPSEDRVTITKSNGSYLEFPSDPRIKTFDKSDHKFIAVANAHSTKPPILQATDSEWWGVKSVLKDNGITVVFLCPKFVETKYNAKKKNNSDVSRN